MKRLRIAVLGCGRIGSAIARDLSADFDVTALDINSEVLDEISRKFGIRTSRLDLTDKDELKKYLDQTDAVVSAVPGFMGYKVLKTIIELGKDVVDISFFNEDPFSLEELAREREVRVVIDCGVAPGLSNIVLGHHAAREKVLEYTCLVGGLPVKREAPFEYKAPFSPIDVIAEYTRPSRLVREGKIMILPALSECEDVEIEGVGLLEAFNTDGLRSIISTMKVPNMVEKTLRYPGHAHLMKAFREGGFFSESERLIGHVKVRPLDLTSQLLFEHWKPAADEEEFTVMRIDLGGENGQWKYQILDRGDPENGMTSMARLTGFTCTSVLRFIIDENVAAGLWPPEVLAGRYKLLDRVLNDLVQKSVSIKIQGPKKS